MRILAKTVTGAVLEVEVDIPSDEEISSVELKDSWNLVNKAQLEMYDAEKFIAMGYEYAHKKPADMIQSAQKFWLAAAWTLKRFFLKLGLHIASHSAMTFFVKFALDRGEPNSTQIYDGWRTAEKFHRVEYGRKSYTLHEFMEKIPEVEYFVETFPKVSVNAVRPVLNEFLEKECEAPKKFKVIIEKKKESVELGKERFDCSYTAY